MVETIFSHPYFVELILPFLLVFTLVFAVLDKSKLLGEGKKQINAIISLVVGLILVSFSYATGIIVNLIPFLAVSLVILFVFMLVWGFISGKKEGDVLSGGMKIALGIIFSLAVVMAVLWVTGFWEKVVNLTVTGEYSGKILLTVIMLVVIGGAIAVVLSGGKKGSESSG